jgi:myo-inositol-1(or 4)-monophosphatase
MAPSERETTALHIVARAGQLARSMFDERGRFRAESKGANDFVSEADRLVETSIREDLGQAFPDEPIMGEELGGHPTGAFWCVDPIDGTANFLRGSPLWGTAVSYLVDDEPQLGVIALPALELLLSASLGGPTSCNGEVLTTWTGSDIPIVSIGEGPHWDPDGIGTFERHLRGAGWGIAAYRSATVGQCFAALGYTDGHLEQWTNLWDIAAGAVICAGVGLDVRIGGDREPGRMHIQAGTPALLAAADAVWPDR